MVMAELFGGAPGYSKGKGGSMHIFDIEHHFYGGYGIVGGQIPLAAGMAFAPQYRNEDGVTVCFFGERRRTRAPSTRRSTWRPSGSCRSSTSARTTATAWAPPSSARPPMPEIYKRAAAYEMRGEPCDGMDVLKMYEAVKDSAEYCRAGKGPVLLEANTYRFRGHSMADPATYRTKRRGRASSKNDPIPKLRVLASSKVATEASSTRRPRWTNARGATMPASWPSEALRPSPRKARRTRGAALSVVLADSRRLD